MRVKKQKKNRKTVKFYSTCYGFKEPLKILSDGTFINHLLLNHLTPADQILSNKLGGKRTKLFVTRCILAELKSLGDPLSLALRAAHDLLIARCEHEPRKSAAGCVEAIIGEKNPEHFFVATQDSSLRKKFREIPGVPVIYGLRNSLFLEQPSTHQRQFVKSVEEERLHMKELEYKMIKTEMNRLAVHGEPEVLDEHEAEAPGSEVRIKPVRNVSRVERGLGVKDKSKFKLKKAKGPNPLSCKKKKQNPTQPSLALDEVYSRGEQLDLTWPSSSIPPQDPAPSLSASQLVVSSEPQVGESNRRSRRKRKRKTRKEDGSNLGEAGSY